MTNKENSLLLTGSLLEVLTELLAYQLASLLDIQLTQNRQKIFKVPLAVSLFLLN